MPSATLRTKGIENEDQGVGGKDDEAFYREVPFRLGQLMDRFPCVLRTPHFAHMYSLTCLLVWW